MAVWRLSLFRSFGFAFEGLGYLLRTQRNARIELACGIVACALGAWLRISPEDWAILLLTIAMVLMAEALNTAIEAAVDLSTPQRNPLAKICKDMAAGMVLIAALASVAVGALLFAPKLLHRLVQ